MLGKGTPGLEARNALLLGQTPMRNRRVTPRPESARRFLACFLAALFLLQPIAQAAPGCSVWALLAGRETCCCDGSAKVEAPSCCAPAETGGDAAGRSLLASAKGCPCEVRGPEPLPALPRPAEARGVDGGSEGSLGRWIGSGAEASAATPLFAGGAPSGLDAPWDGPHLAPCAPAPELARGRRALLLLICVARC